MRPIRKTDAFQHFLNGLEFSGPFSFLGTKNERNQIDKEHALHHGNRRRSTRRSNQRIYKILGQGFSKQYDLLCEEGIYVHYRS